MTIENKEKYNLHIDIALGISLDIVNLLYQSEVNVNCLKSLINNLMLSDLTFLKKELNEKEPEYIIYSENKIRFLRIENENLNEIIKNKEEFSKSILDFKRMSF